MSKSSIPLALCCTLSLQTLPLVLLQTNSRKNSLSSDLPRSFNRGEREKPEREGGARGGKREGRGSESERAIESETGKERTGFSTFTAALAWATPFSTLLSFERKERHLCPQVPYSSSLTVLSSLSPLTERLRESVSHSCDLHRTLGPGSSGTHCCYLHISLNNITPLANFTWQFGSCVDNTQHYIHTQNWAACKGKGIRHTIAVWSLELYLVIPLPNRTFCQRERGGTDGNFQLGRRGGRTELEMIYRLHLKRSRIKNLWPVPEAVNCHSSLQRPRHNPTTRSQIRPLNIQQPAQRHLALCITVRRV